jgi:hypothetical protein
VRDMIRTLRAEMENLAADLGSAWPVAARDNGSGASGGGRADRLPAAADVQTRSEHAGNHAEVEQMIIDQVEILFREGRSRAEAERFVMRFKQGQDYLHVVDEVYTPES